MAAEETSNNSNTWWPKTSQHATNRIKFYCSHGGMILPRPCDGHLKYVGGETRVISAPGSVSFWDLMRKINSMFEGDYVIKYQIGPEELDALVSVKSNEDLCYMLDEYDRLERGGASRLRTYLFPSRPLVGECPAAPLQSLEQRYVDALNGVVRPSSSVMVGGRRPMSRLKSMCSSPSESSTPCSLSPRSVAHSAASSTHADTAASASFIGKLSGMTRVHSSPSLCGLNNSGNESGGHLVYQPGGGGGGGGYPGGGGHHPHHRHYDATPPWMSPVRDDYARVSVITNHPPPPANIHATSTTHCHPFHKGGGGGHSRWAHPGPSYAVGVYANRPITAHSESRGIIWE